MCMPSKAWNYMQYVCPGEKSTQAGTPFEFIELRFLKSLLQAYNWRNYIRYLLPRSCSFVPSPELMFVYESIPLRLSWIWDVKFCSEVLFGIDILKSDDFPSIAFLCDTVKKFDLRGSVEMLYRGYLQWNLWGLNNSDFYQCLQYFI